jgi:ubiquinone/menaquinone biosynthesis C-methylase UbiE
MAHTSDRRFRSDDPERLQWQDPGEILSVIGLGPGQVFVDLGCGEGFFAVPAAKLVGEQGTVYAVDINAEAIERLLETAAKEHLDNLVAQSGEGEDTVFCEACADIVFFGIDLHDFRDPASVLRNARRMIKPGGKLIDLDWKKEPMPTGPPLEIRFDEAQAAGLIEAAGFEVESVSEHGPFHYIIVARPV